MGPDFNSEIGAVEKRRPLKEFVRGRNLAGLPCELNPKRSEKSLNLLTLGTG